MPSYPSGLIITPTLGAAQVSSVEMTFEPSIGIMARKVDKAGANIRSFREPLRESIRDVVIPSIQMNFHKSGRPRWADLAESTWKQKGIGEKILIRTGALMKTMSYMNIWHIDSEKAMLANLPQKVWYGALHQAGHGAHDVQGKFAYYGGHRSSATQIGTENVGEEGSLPPRPFVMLQPQDMEEIDAIFVRWVGKRVRAAGL